MIAISPGVPLADSKVAAAAKHTPVVGDVELFALALADHPSRSSPNIIAITGSNGKSTVTEMVGAMCRAAGQKTMVAGNIGLPVLDALAEAEVEGMPDVFVLELSSFQLETTYSLNPAAATVLNVSEDHLDRYNGMEGYVAAKARIFQGSGMQIVNRDDPRTLTMTQPRCTQTFGLDAPANPKDWGLLAHEGKTWLAHGTHPLMPLDTLPLTGLHNAANALAALALCRAIDLPVAPLLAGLKTFKGLPHRVEKVAYAQRDRFF